MEVDWVKVEQKAWQQASTTPSPTSTTAARPAPPAPNKAGCYFWSPAKSAVAECGGPFTDWTRDAWGEKHKESGESKAKCLARKDGHDAHCKIKSTWIFVAESSALQPGCYYKQPSKSAECGGPFPDWNRDMWGETNKGSAASESKCLARKKPHDMHCDTDTTWKFVTGGGSSMQPGCYYKQPSKTVECGGPFPDWNRDIWGEKNREAGTSESKCLARKKPHDDHCDTDTTWKFIAA